MTRIHPTNEAHAGTSTGIGLEILRIEAYVARGVEKEWEALGVSLPQKHGIDRDVPPPSSHHIDNLVAAVQTFVRVRGRFVAAP